VIVNGLGVKVIACTGVRVNPFDRSLHTTRFMGVNYMLIASRGEYGKSGVRETVDQSGADPEPSSD